jgi:hypothetical protein
MKGERRERGTESYADAVPGRVTCVSAGSRPGADGPKLWHGRFTEHTKFTASSSGSSHRVRSDDRPDDAHSIPSIQPLTKSLYRPRQLSTDI